MPWVGTPWMRVVLRVLKFVQLWLRGFGSYWLYLTFDVDLEHDKVCRLRGPVEHGEEAVGMRVRPVGTDEMLADRMVVKVQLGAHRQRRGKTDPMLAGSRAFRGS